MGRVRNEMLSCTWLRVSDLRGQQTHTLEEILPHLSGQQITQVKDGDTDIHLGILFCPS